MNNREIWKKYLKAMRNQEFLGWMGDFPEYEFTIDFCQDNDLYEEFVACKLRLDGFYGFARYKAGEISLETFENKIIPILNRKSNRF